MPWTKESFVKRQKDKDQKQSLLLWCHGSFALLRCFSMIYSADGSSNGEGALNSTYLLQVSFDQSWMWEKSFFWEAIYIWKGFCVGNNFYIFNSMEASYKLGRRIQVELLAEIKSINLKSGANREIVKRVQMDLLNLGPVHVDSLKGFLKQRNPINSHCLI